MLNQTVLVPTTILAAHSNSVIGNGFINNTVPEDRFVRHAAQRRFMANLYNAGSSLLNSLQTTETTQSVQKEQQAQQTTLFQWSAAPVAAPSVPVQHTSLFQLYEQSKRAPVAASVAAPVPVAAATTAPRIQLRSHPTQSDLVQRFASFFTPSMSTQFAACEPEETKKAPEPTSWRWFS